MALLIALVAPGIAAEDEPARVKLPQEASVPPVIKQTPEGILLAPADAQAVEAAAVREIAPTPVPVERIKPIYPGEAWTARIEGYVEVEIEVLANGRVGTITTLGAERGDVFGPAVIEAVKRWRFEPSKYASRPFVQRIEFVRRVVLLPSLVPVPNTPYFNPDEK